MLDADLVIGAVLVPGRQGADAGQQRAGLADEAGLACWSTSPIDQGGCFEDSRPTTHADPTYRVHDSVFYCVANMPGAVPHTSTYALTNVTLPYARGAGQPGLARRRCATTRRWRSGLNTHDGQVTYGAGRRGARA